MALLTCLPQRTCGPDLPETDWDDTPWPPEARHPSPFWGFRFPGPSRAFLLALPRAPCAPLKLFKIRLA